METLSFGEFGQGGLLSFEPHPFLREIFTGEPDRVGDGTDSEILRRRRNEAQTFLYAFDLSKLNGTPSPLWSYPQSS
jgi:hypothetical protein